MPMLDIIVPHYDEPWSEGKKLFDMLGMQRAVDMRSFRVILVEDGEGHNIYPEIAKQRYPFEVVGLTIPHAGVSAARNRGMDYSRAKWIMFCDFDDTFTCIYSLRSIMDVLPTEDYDLLWYPFYVETNAERKRQIRQKYNNIFIHGKVYRRDFLREHGLRFNEELHFSEDTAFNSVLEMEIRPDRTGEIKMEIAPYVWTYREKSATTDPARVYGNAVGLFRRQKYVAEQFVLRGRWLEGSSIAMRAMCDGFLTLKRTDIQHDDSFAREVYEFYGHWRHMLQTVNQATIETAYNGALHEATVYHGKLPEIDEFRAWFDSLGLILD